LTDRSRRPYRHANRLPFQIENLILQLKERHSSWGAQKIGTRSNCCIARSTFPRSAPSMQSWSTRPGQQWAQEALQGRRHDAEPCDSTQRSVVRRLQG
jgi:hypothetical protein